MSHFLKQRCSYLRSLQALKQCSKISISNSLAIRADLQGFLREGRGGVVGDLPTLIKGGEGDRLIPGAGARGVSVFFLQNKPSHC